ncbi:IclR family transcriptional regulator [Paucibacter sp. PLA-PC-4]|uniref:IclR family transcriptional regulator n=1 Tax=Paucibacter sp. PLA-PC-4 TaxID=2993655 RepID=UPI002249734F|nr:IclR family transcriptional regulator [Paucibacter sp. PLA-PC-4]MCX2861753.1 IclR family transcriptional regulator [Paucibacter sp. PLA-PC-4]
MDQDKLPSLSAETSRTDRNRSLERGIEILRAFRPGADLLGNGELAERSGLSRATVSRLAQTLVDCGMLEHDRRHRAYRLAAPVLSLAHAMRSGSPVLQLVGPLMRSEAEKRKINIGLAVADREDMVYLESVRFSRRVAWRNVVAGQRVPMELTSLGRAWLAAASHEERQRLLMRFRERRHPGWRELSREIAAGIDSVRTLGYCWAAWQPQVVALATPIIVPDHPVYVLNMSVAGDTPPQQVVESLRDPLLNLAQRIQGSVASL